MPTSPIANLRTGPIAKPAKNIPIILKMDDLLWIKILPIAMGISQVNNIPVLIKTSMIPLCIWGNRMSSRYWKNTLHSKKLTIAEGRKARSSSLGGSVLMVSYEELTSFTLLSNLIFSFSSSYHTRGC